MKSTKEKKICQMGKHPRMSMFIHLGIRMAECLSIYRINNKDTTVVSSHAAISVDTLGLG